MILPVDGRCECLQKLERNFDRLLLEYLGQLLISCEIRNCDSKLLNLLISLLYFTVGVFKTLHVQVPLGMLIFHFSYILLFIVNDLVNIDL